MAPPLPNSASRVADLIEFEQAAIGRWETRVRNLPADAPPQFPHGYHDVGMAIDGAFNVQTSPSCETMQQRSAITPAGRHS